MTGLCSDTVAAYNAEREEVHARRQQVNGELTVLVGILALMTLLGGFVLAQLFTPDFAIMVVATIAILGAAGVVHWLRVKAAAPKRALQARMREVVFPTIFPEIEELHFQPTSTGFFDEIPDVLRPKPVVEILRFGAPKLRYEYGDLIEGVYQGLPIALCEVEITQSVQRGRYTARETLFEGVTVKFELAESVPSISVARNEGAPSQLALLGRQLRPLIGRSKFEQRPLDLDSDLQCASACFADKVFGGDGLQRFQMLQATHAKGDLSFAARNWMAYVLIETDKNYFELPPLTQSFDPVADVRRLRGEMSGFLELISDLREMLNPNAATHEHSTAQSA